jgi:hypothetical protein
MNYANLIEVSSFRLLEFVTYVALLLVIFLIIRVVVLWYYRIDERVNLMKENNRLLRELVEMQAQKKKESDSGSTGSSVTDLNNPQELEKLLSKLNQPK